jgi:hypothetical protein
LKDVILENITYPSPGLFASRILGADAAHPVTDVSCRRLRWGKDLLRSDNLKERIIINEFVQGFTIE